VRSSEERETHGAARRRGGVAQRRGGVGTEGPIRWPERVERMGADKNSSRRMNSSYAPNSQLRIPTRVYQGHVVTTNQPTLGTNPNNPKAKTKLEKQRT
jgi:hypothetical protein